MDECDAACDGGENTTTYPSEEIFSLFVPMYLAIFWAYSHVFSLA